MFNLSEIMQSAQGGQAVANIARQFGLTPEQAQAAINGLLPAFSVALQSHAQNMGSLAQIVGTMLSGQHATTFDDPSAHLTQQTMAAGTNVLGQLFGQGQAVSAIIQQVSRSTGINPGTLMAMMPIIASLLMSGLFKSASNQGLGGVLGQLVSSVLGGGGGVAGMPGAQQPGQPPGGVLGNILGGMLQGGATPQPTQPAAPQPTQPAAPQPTPAMPGVSPAMQAGINILTGMFQAGAQAQGAHASALQEILNAYTRGAAR
jgi:hypothetical protein